MKIPAIRIISALIAAAAAASALVQGTGWYPVVIAVTVFGSAVVLPQLRENRIALLAAGELLVVAVAAVSFWAGVIVQCAVIGAVVPDARLPADKRDLTLVGFFCIAALACALFFDRSNMVLIPFLAVTAAAGAATIIFIGVGEMRERRRYAGGK